MRGDSQATTTLYGIEGGKKGIVQTLKLMRSITNRFKTDIKIRERAQHIVSHVNQKDWLNEARAVQDWVRNNVRYTRDVAGVETIATPDHTLYTRHGDCDDQSILVASLLESIGHPTRFVAVGALPGVYSHVYVETKIKDAWLPVETTEDWRIGHGPPVVRAKLVVENRSKKNIGLMQKKGNNMDSFEEAESELDAELDALLLAKTVRDAGYTLEEYYDGLNGLGEMHGFFKRLKKRHKKLKKKVKNVVKKVVKVAAVAAAVYFTGGALLGVAAAAKQAKERAKAEAEQAENENARIEAGNAIVMAQQAEYDQAMAIQAKAEQEAAVMLRKQGIKMGTPQARAYLAKSIKLQTAKLAAGKPMGEPSTLKKLAPVAAIGIPLIAAMTLGG